MRTVVGLFDRFEDAQRAVQALNEAGFDRNQISLVASDEKGEYSRYLEGAQGEDVTDGAATGAGIGAVLGGLGGLLVGLGALAIPGIGPVLAAGPLVSTLAGAGIGAAAGGIVGALVDLGIPEDHARAYEEGIRGGGTLVTLRADDHRADEAVSIMNRFNPIDIEGRMRGYTDSDVHSTDFDRDRESVGSRDVDRIPVTGDDDVTIPVIEEDIHVDKREVEHGGMRVQAHVEEEPFEEDITLRKETFNVERRPVDREVTHGDRFVEGEMELHEKSEEPIVSKHQRVVEEVHIDKDVEQVTEKIRETLRHQRVDVDRIDMEDYRRREPTFRQHYETQYRSMGQDYDYYSPAYRYGYALGGDPRFRNYDWNRLEPGLRDDWGRLGYTGSWDDMRDAVRYGWESNRTR